MEPQPQQLRNSYLLQPTKPPLLRVLARCYSKCLGAVSLAGVIPFCFEEENSENPMKAKYWKLTVGLTSVVASIAVAIAASTPREKGTVLTQEQVKKLFAKAARVEKQPAVRKAVKNRKGDVVGYTTSQTVVVYMRGGVGGGRGLNVQTLCTKSCGGTPINLDPSNPNNTCSGQSPTGCSPENGTCSTCTCPNGCSCSCSGTTTGFGNVGVFLAMADADEAAPELVATK